MIMMKNLDDNLPLNKTLELYNMVTIVRAVFQKSNKFYFQVFLGECMVYYDRIDVSEGIEINKTSEARVRCLSVLVFSK